jgi:hypothetical protein
MSGRRIATMFRRDMRDAIRDGRILVAIAIPVALAIFYGLTAPDDGGGPGGTTLSVILVVFSIVMLACFIAFLVVPVLFVEEIELGTLEALQLVARTPEIIVAKLAVGICYCAIALGLTLAVVDVRVESWPGFVVAAAVMSVALAGFGLMFGVALGDASRVNTWSGVVLLPLMAPPFLVFGDTLPDAWQAVVGATPSGAGALLLARAADPAMTDFLVLPIVALLAWTVVGFLLLWRMLERRQA